jgi:hypothetical protein
MVDEPVRVRLESLGPAQVRLLLSNGGWPAQLHIQAVEWLAEKDREERAIQESRRDTEIDIARSARDAALDANELAKAANSIALAASASAERSAVAAMRNNRIAIAAVIIAAAAMLIALIGIFTK